jgi:hypothetical protein
VPGEGFSFGVVHQGLVVALFPQVHPLPEAQSDVLGPTHPWRRLQDSGDEDQGAFRVPSAFTNAPELLGQDGQKSPSDFARRDLVSGCGKLDHPQPATLPFGVVGYSPPKVCSRIVMGVVAQDGVEQAVCCGGSIAWKISSNIWGERRDWRCLVVAFS